MGNHKISMVYHHFLYEHIRYPFLAIPRFQAHPFDSLWRYTFMCISRFLPARYLSKDWFQGQFRGHQCLFLLPPINMRVPICFSPRFSMIFPHTHQLSLGVQFPNNGFSHRGHLRRVPVPEADPPSPHSRCDRTLMCVKEHDTVECTAWKQLWFQLWFML